MTNSSQRRGLDPSRPGEEMIIGSAISNQWKGDRKAALVATRELAAKILEHGRAHLHQSFIEDLEATAAGKGGGVSAVFSNDLEAVEKIIADLAGDWVARNKKEGIPVSIRLVGLTTDVRRCCQKAGIKEHTYLHSLGPFGRRVNELPSEDELCLITMCGHGFIARNRVRSLVRSIQDGELTAREAADDIARPCRCGLTNRPRAEQIFQRLASRA